MKLLNSGRREHFPAVRLAFCVILVLAASGGRPTPARAAGIITHNVVVQRAIDMVEANHAGYKDLAVLLREHAGVVDYGSMFPDWAYPNSLGELPHDTDAARKGKIGPFRAALTARLLPAFRYPQSEDDRKAVAFLLGLISHQEADVPYHFGNCDANGECDDRGLQPVFAPGILHTPFELKQDAILFWTLGDPSVDWSSPVVALVDTYRRVAKDLGDEDYGVTGAELENARWKQEAIRGGIAVAASNRRTNPLFLFLCLGTDGYTNVVKLRYFHWFTYVPGGVEDMASRTVEAWKWTWDWLSTYTPVTTISLYPAQPDGENGSYRGPVSIALGATDNFTRTGGVKSWIDTRPFETFYSVDGDAHLLYTEPFTICAKGAHAISFYSVDSFGVREDPQTVTLNIESSKPGASWVCGGPNLPVNSGFE